MEPLIITVIISGVSAVTAVAFFAIYRFGKNYYKNYVREPLSSLYHDTLNCPRCSKTMEKGVIYTER